MWGAGNRLVTDTRHELGGVNNFSNASILQLILYFKTLFSIANSPSAKYKNTQCRKYSIRDIKILEPKYSSLSLNKESPYLKNVCLCCSIVSLFCPLFLIFHFFFLSFCMSDLVLLHKMSEKGNN